MTRHTTNPPATSAPRAFFSRIALAHRKPTTSFTCLSCAASRPAACALFSRATAVRPEAQPSQKPRLKKSAAEKCGTPERRTLPTSTRPSLAASRHTACALFSRVIANAALFAVRAQARRRKIAPANFIYSFFSRVIANAAPSFAVRAQARRRKIAPANFIYSFFSRVIANAAPSFAVRAQARRRKIAPANFIYSFFSRATAARLKAQPSQKPRLKKSAAEKCDTPERRKPPTSTRPSLAALRPTPHTLFSRATARLSRIGHTLLFAYPLFAALRHAARALFALCAVFFLPAPIQAQEKINPVLAEQDWVLHCRGCHGTHGEIAREGMPLLAGEMSKFLSVQGGRAYLIQVPGVANAPMSDARLANLTNWMLREFDPDNIPPHHTPYTADEIHTLRQTSLIPNAATVREKLVKLMGE